MEFNQSTIKTFAAHLKTLGAYVQQPTPQIAGVKQNEIIFSSDAASLYPTIMVLLNIGYDTFMGRVYDNVIVDKTINMIKTIQSQYNTNTEEYIRDISIQFSGAIYNLAKNYCETHEEKNPKADFLEFHSKFYKASFEKLIRYRGDFKNILKPNGDKEYYLLKSVLLPLLETLTWLSSFNKGYNNTLFDYVFDNISFDEKYNNKTFYVAHNINSTKAELLEIQLETFKKEIAEKYIVTPYGTYFYKHSVKKSFEVDLILGGQADRNVAKNAGLILGAIIENWDKISTDIQLKFLTEEILSSDVCDKILEVVGDSDINTRAKQKKALINIKIGITEIITPDKIREMLKIIESSNNDDSSTIKVTLNSGYGLYGMPTWQYANNIIANSITTSGKIYGTKLFQQVASNVLSN
jgi:DNA polymerase elongation subunit (family B)